MKLLYDIGEKPNKFKAKVGDEYFNVKDKKSYLVDKFGEVHTIATNASETVELTLANSWVDYADGYGTPQVKRQGRHISIECVVKSGTTTAGTILTTLPEGYRPSKHLAIATISNAGFGYVVILIDGTVQLYGADATWTSITVSFITA